VCSYREAKVRGNLHEFDGEMAALDRALKRTAPQSQAPRSLHGSIMRAVRAAPHPAAEARSEWAFGRWLPVPIAAVIALTASLYHAQDRVGPPAKSTQPLAIATTALQAGGDMARAVPSAVVAPLTDELQKLNQDLNNTAQFLLASLP
jgi:hypothetical protein